MLGVRRMNGRELPSLIQKKIKIQSRKIDEKKEEKKTVNWPEDYQPKIFSLKKTDELPKLRWMTI